MRRRVVGLAVVIVVAVAGAVTAWQRLAATDVETATVTRGPAVRAVYATGTVEPVVWAKVGPVTTGRIKSIEARDGKVVLRGERLAALDDREAQARLAELAARERYWREEAARQATLAERGIATREARERVAAEHLAAQAAIAAQQQRIADLVMVAPMDGVVLRQDGEVGEVVKSDDTLFWVGQPLPLRITAEVDEEDIPRVHPEQLALVKADAFPGEVLRGMVAEVTPKGDPVAKNYRVRIALPRDTRLRIGMTVEVNVVVEEMRDAVLVPAASVRVGADGRHVFVVADGAARRRSVRLGIEGRSSAEVLSGLEPGETVVINPPPGLADGHRVRAAGG
jgi:RND family efflux transporter MFP subunit